MDLFYTETHHQKNETNKQKQKISSQLLTQKTPNCCLRDGSITIEDKASVEDFNQILTFVRGRCFLSLKESYNFIFICVLDSSNDLGTA